MNDLNIKTDDFFEISFKDNKINRELNLVSYHKDTYGQNGNQEEIDCILSHLVTLDDALHYNISITGDLAATRQVYFSIVYADNGKRVEESLSVPLGMGHFRNGINFLRESFPDTLYTTSSLEEILKLKKPIDRLDKFCAVLDNYTRPLEISLDKLETKGYKTIEKMWDLMENITYHVRIEHIYGTQKAIIEHRQKNDEKINYKEFEQLMIEKIDDLITPERIKQYIKDFEAEEERDRKERFETESRPSVSQEKLEEIKKRSKEAIKNQKKVKSCQKSEAIRIHR